MGEAASSALVSNYLSFITNTHNNPPKIINLKNTIRKHNLSKKSFPLYYKKNLSTFFSTLSYKKCKIKFVYVRGRQKWKKPIRSYNVFNSNGREFRRVIKKELYKELKKKTKRNKRKMKFRRLKNSSFSPAKRRRVSLANKIDKITKLQNMAKKLFNDAKVLSNKISNKTAKLTLKSRKRNKKHYRKVFIESKIVPKKNKNVQISKKVIKYQRKKFYLYSRYHRYRRYKKKKKFFLTRRMFFTFTYRKKSKLKQKRNKKLLANDTPSQINLKNIVMDLPFLYLTPIRETRSTTNRGHAKPWKKTILSSRIKIYQDMLKEVKLLISDYSESSLKKMPKRSREYKYYKTHEKIILLKRKLIKKTLKTKRHEYKYHRSFVQSSKLRNITNNNYFFMVRRIIWNIINYKIRHIYLKLQKLKRFLGKRRFFRNFKKLYHLLIHSYKILIVSTIGLRKALKRKKKYKAKYITNIPFKPQDFKTKYILSLLTITKFFSFFIKSNKQRNLINKKLFIKLLRNKSIIPRIPQQKVSKKQQAPIHLMESEKIQKQSKTYNELKIKTQSRHNDKYDEIFKQKDRHFSKADMKEYYEDRDNYLDVKNTQQDFRNLDEVMDLNTPASAKLLFERWNRILSLPEILYKTQKSQGDNVNPINETNEEDYTEYE